MIKQQLEAMFPQASQEAIMQAVSTSQSVAEAIDKLLPSSSGSVRVNGKDKYSCSYITSETNQSEWHPNDKYT